MKIKNSGTVRRTDLYLRTKYPELETTIYRINNESFVIYCKNLTENFEDFKKKFKNEIKLVFAPVEVVKKIPKKYQEIIPEILDNEISKNFEGIGMSKITLFNLLHSKFPEVNFYKLDDDSGVVNIYIANYSVNKRNTKHLIFLNKFQEKALEKFLVGLNSDVKFNIIVKEFSEKPSIEKNNILNPVSYIYASKLSHNKFSVFSKRDEALWFDKVDNIFEGSFTKSDLYFYNETDYSCYVDYSAFPNIDLRNHLFLYQVVFITPPFDKSIIKWLKESKIDKKEFLNLVERKRIKLILTQPEFRYDIGFINEVYAIDSNAVITRRALSCLQQIDLVEKSNNYIFNDVQSINDIKKFTIAIAEKLNKDPKLLFDTIVWPIKALRNSFEVLNNSGLLSASVYGVNKILQKGASDAFKKDLEFEYTVNSPSIHLAHSLNATYFPFRAENYSDEFYASTMGTMLNFYKNATPNNLKSFIQNDNQVKTGVPIINPIELIDVNDFISITELEDVLSKDVIFPNSKTLIETLAVLNEKERKEKIKFYNTEVLRKINKSKKQVGTIDLSTNLLLDAVGLFTGIPGLGTMLSVAKSGIKLTKQDGSIKNITRKLEEALNKDSDNQNINYLTKISSVVKLKKV